VNRHGPKFKLAMQKHLAVAVGSRPEVNSKEGVASFALLCMRFTIDKCCVNL